MPHVAIELLRIPAPVRGSTQEVDPYPISIDNNADCKVSSADRVSSFGGRARRRLTRHGRSNVAAVWPRSPRWRDGHACPEEVVQGERLNWARLHRSLPRVVKCPISPAALPVPLA